MMLCLAVRLSRKTKNAIGAAVGPQDMLWVESQHCESEDASNTSPSQNPAPSQPKLSIGRVRWYRLPGMTFMSP